MTLRVNERQEVSQMVFNPSASTNTKEAPKTSKDKDTLTSAAPKTEEAKKTFGEKVKTFFAGIWAWITAHLLCCFFKKKEAKDENVSKKEEVSQVATVEERADIEKEMAFRRFNKLTDAEKQEWRGALKAFKDSVKTPEEIQKAFSLIEKLVEKKEAGEEEIIALIDASEATGKEKMKTDFAKDPKGFFQEVEKILRATSLTIKHSEMKEFLTFINDPNKSDLEIDAVFRNLSMATKDRLLEAYQQTNGKVISTERLLSRILKTSPDGSADGRVSKMVDEIKSSISKEENELENSGKEEKEAATP